MTTTTTTATALRNIYIKHQKITPQVVVDESRPEEAPLHSRFEWDDSVAGEAYRRQQAAQMIRSVDVEFAPAQTSTDAKPIKVRQYVPTRLTSQDDDATGEYRAIQDVPQDAQAVLLAQMEREWRNLRRRWQSHREFFDAMVQRDLAA